MVNNLLSTPLGRFRIIAILEGISFIVLLLNRYVFEVLNRYAVGMTHGVLFIFYLITLAHVMYALKWSIGRGFIALIASLLPFGTFVLDAKLLKEEMPSNPSK